MKLPRTLAVFLCAAGAALALAILKALVVSGLGTLPPVRVLLFASTTFGLLAALLDWGIFRDLLPHARTTPPILSEPPPQVTGPIIERARACPIVFREICPPPASGLSFYGGAPIGPENLDWPRCRNKPDDTPLSFVMQWDCTDLAGEDETGLLPKDGVLYLFCDLVWGDPFEFRFVHATGPVKDWRPLPVPPGLPPVYGSEGVHQVPYCSPLVAADTQDPPRLLPRWPFTPVAFTYPAIPSDADGRFWNDGELVAQSLLRLQHPEGVPPAKPLNKQQPPFARPFPAFPHDHAAVRIVAAKVLDQLRRPSTWLLREGSGEEREARFQRWRDEASQYYATAAAHDPAASVEPSLRDDLWRWMEAVEPLLWPGWDSLVEECVNVSLGLGSQAANAIPANLIAVCAERHRLALAYPHDEYPDRSKPEALAAWEERKAAGALKIVRSVHAPCPNHMFGPPSFVQGYVEEHLEEQVLLLELSTRGTIGHQFGEGVFQFMIRPVDLQERRFDKVILIASAY